MTASRLVRLTIVECDRSVDLCPHPDMPEHENSLLVGGRTGDASFTEGTVGVAYRLHLEDDDGRARGRHRWSELSDPLANGI